MPIKIAFQVSIYFSMPTNPTGHNTIILRADSVSGNTAQ